MILNTSNNDIDTNRTPNGNLPPLNPSTQRRKMLIEVEVGADFESRFDNQWEVEREIHADRWSWKWKDDRPREGS